MHGVNTRLREDVAVNTKQYVLGKPLFAEVMFVLKFVIAVI
jgi:hypothetical protein